VTRGSYWWGTQHAWGRRKKAKRILVDKEEGTRHMFVEENKVKGKGTGPEGSKWLRFTDFKTIGT